MQVTLYAIPGSHPCAAVERALELKGIAYDRVDMLPGVVKLQQRLRFGGTTVPGIEVGGARVLGSRPIVHKLEEIVPEPRLLPAEPDARAEVERAEEWGEEVLQPLVRRLSWAALRRAPAALPSYAVGARLPIPLRVAALGSRPVTIAAAKANGATDANVRADLIGLPGHLDRIDGWIERGVLGGRAPNAADLQIGSGLRLLLTIGDVAPLVAARPAAALARAQFPRYAGSVPLGTLPAAWLPG